ncbi:MAG TPA: 30S ribosomal protein S20 [bacterium]
MASSAVKRARKSKAQRVHNKHYRSLMRTAVKKVLSCKDKESAQKELVQAVSILDKLASKRIIHKNKASNQKSRLTLFVNRIGPV